MGRSKGLPIPQDPCRAGARPPPCCRALPLLQGCIFLCSPQATQGVSKPTFLSMLVAIPAGSGILRNIPSQHCNPASHDSSSLRRRQRERGLDSLFTKREIWGHPGRQIKASKESGSRSRAGHCGCTLKDVSLGELPRSHGLLPRTLTCHQTRLHVM